MTELGLQMTSTIGPLDIAANNLCMCRKVKWVYMMICRWQ